MTIKTVAFAIPTLSRSVAIEFFTSAMQTDWLLTQNGYACAYITWPGDQFIANARNQLVGDFLRNHPGVDNFFFLDDDLGWPAAKVLEILERPEDVVVGVYPKKSDAEDWPVMLAGDGGDLIERDGLVRVLRAPTGFMRIKRRVFEALQSQTPAYKWQTPTGEVRETPAFFSAGVAEDGWWWSEDYIFSENLQRAGFEIWADPDIDFTHRGSNAWRGALRDAMPIFRDKARIAENARQTGGDAIEDEITRSDAA